MSGFRRAMIASALAATGTYRTVDGRLFWKGTWRCAEHAGWLWVDVGCPVLPAEWAELAPTSRDHEARTRERR